MNDVISLKPFFCFYGGKRRAAMHYPEPFYDTIVEPFAGSAGYSLYYSNRKIRLSDADPRIVGIWDYLIRASSDDIRNLPTVVPHVDEINVCDEAKWLIGFWLNKGASSPCKSPSSWMRLGTHSNSFWGEAIKNRIISQQPFIRHWKVELCDYGKVENTLATWFIDPPYANAAGRHYKQKVTDYDQLSEWCSNRQGQIIVCENEGANWLPFKSFRTIKGTEGKRRSSKSVEVLYTGENP